MTTNEIIELATQGYASTRDAIKWAIEQERNQCAKVCEALRDEDGYESWGADCAAAIRARN